MTKSKRTTTSSIDRTTTPIEPDEFVSLGNTIRAILEENLGRGLPFGFEERGLEGVNRAFRGAQAGAENILTSRGLARSPVAGDVLSNIDLSRRGSAANFLSSIPAQEQSARDRALLQAIAFFGTRPIGQRTRGTSQSETVQTQSALSTIAQIVAGGAGLATGFGFGGFGGRGASTAPSPFRLGATPTDFGFNNLDPPPPSFFTQQQLFGG